MIEAMAPSHPIGPSEFGRLVVVTNREPFQIKERDGTTLVEKSAGGLIAAVEPAMARLNGLWVSADPKKGTDDPRMQAQLEKLPYRWAAADVPEALHDDYYYGFSNGALWPLYHSLLGTVHYHRHQWAAYRDVNLAFAEKVRAVAEEGDFIWVHDYQLSLLPRYIREGALPPEVRIGYFLHIPFPPYDLFRTLPWAKEILLGMLGASIIGFHVAAYCHNFFECVEELLGIRTDRLRGRVKIGDRYVNVRAVPIGIDAQGIGAAVETEAVQRRAAELKEVLAAEHIVIGVDRLDYTKGIPERLRALETFFERYPHRRGQVSLVQIAVPSRTHIDEYQQLREEIERQVGHINGLYGETGWTPVHYQYRSVPFDELVAHYLAADVALITPLRDGMNLVAKEYVAAHHGRGGTLILSELAGASQQLTEAEMVNPYDVDGMAEALERVLDRSDEKQRRLMRTMSTKVRRFDMRQWSEAFLAEAFLTE